MGEGNDGCGSELLGTTFNQQGTFPDRTALVLCIPSFNSVDGKVLFCYSGDTACLLIFTATVYLVKYGSTSVYE